MPQIRQNWIPKASLVGILQSFEYRVDLTPRHSEYHLMVLGSAEEPVTTAGQDELAFIAE